MNTKANELLAERAKLVKESRDILNKADAENRDLNDTEREHYDRIDNEIDSLKNRADRLVKADALDATLDQLQEKSVKASVEIGRKNPFASSEYNDAFMNGYTRKRVTPDVRNALEVGTDSEGGYIVPTEFETQLVETLLDFNEIRQYANVIQTGSTRNIPVESTVPTAAWTDEEAAYNESNPVFGQVVLNAYKATCITKVSEELLADAFFDVSSFLARAFGKALGTLEETAFVVGTGSTQPTGIVTGASDSGVTFASSTVPTSDELIDVYHALSRPYRTNATWLTSDTFIKAVRKLKVAGTDDYLWQSGLRDGQPDMLLGRPVIASSAVVVPATTVKSVVFGDLSNYTIADRSQRTIQRLDELYAATGQVGFKINSRTEGKVTNSAGIVYADHT